MTYSDVQNYFKQLRNRGLKFRYLVVGEIGKLKGRTHWHIVIFFQEKLPNGFWDYGRNSWFRDKRDDPVFVPLVWNKKFNEPCWPHGFSQWDPLHAGHTKGGVRYACKYINKDVDDESAQSKLCMSKNPPIGAVYFEQRAKRFVDQGISPQDASYTFPHEAKRISDGKPVKFRLANKSSDLFCENFILSWRGFPKPWGMFGPPVFTGRPWHYPESEYVEEFEDRMNSDLVVADPEFLQWYKAKPWRNVDTATATQVRPIHITEKEWLQARSKRTRLVVSPPRDPLFVLWIKSASKGRWKTARTITDNEKPVWLKSQMS